jgi:molecular chaperone DnaK (HSP70)
MNVSVCRVCKVKVTVASFAYDENLGGSHFTIALADFLSQKIGASFSVDPLKNKRSALRFNRAVETLKRNLSINPVVYFELPDSEVSFPVKRTEFEQQIGPLLPRIEPPVQQALQLAGVQKEDLFAIEILGGASRVPAVRAELQRILGREPTQSLNPDECFAVGAGFLSAILSPSFRISMSVEDASPYAVHGSWEDDDGPHNFEPFPQFSAVPSTVTLPLALKKRAEIKFSTDFGALGSVQIEMEDSDEPKTVLLTLKLTQSSTLECVQAALESNETLPVSFVSAIGLKEDVIRGLAREEERLLVLDVREMAVDNARNELESRLFQMENGIARDFRDCFSPAELEHATLATNQVREWFNDHESDRFPITEYRARIDELMRAGAAAMERDRLFRRIVDSEETFRSRIAALRTRLGTLREEVRGTPTELIDAFERNLTADWQEIASVPRHTPPPPLVEAAEAELHVIEREIAKIEVAERARAERGGWGCSVA